ncbi:MAG TPA: ABC transporter substrate-binding protein [Streptosporangiaceae bacterium]|nr:ABC transporter substrate-binding protein [Streptosporangiaceae bacterium]
MAEDRLTSEARSRLSGPGRRRFLQAAGVGGLILGAGGSLAACGSSGGSSSSSAQTGGGGGGGKPKHGGVLKVAIAGGSTSDTMDPNNAYNTPDWVRVPTVYEQLANIDANGLAQLQLAEEITPNADATEWTVRVRKGVTFHHGKELTADDVMFTIARILDPKALAEGWTLINSIDVKGMKKLDKYTCKIPCKTPFATFKDTFACWNFAIVPSQGFDPKTPKGMVGTGAFKVSSFNPGVESVPNLVSVLMVEIGLRLTFSITLIAGLTFIGFGLRPPAPNWGIMINENRIGLTLNPWAVLAPITLIAILTIGMNLLTDAFASVAIGVDRAGDLMVEVTP